MILHFVDTCTVVWINDNLFALSYGERQNGRKREEQSSFFLASIRRRYVLGTETDGRTQDIRMGDMCVCAGLRARGLFTRNTYAIECPVLVLLIRLERSAH